MNDRPNVQLVDMITCPCCYSEFPPEEVHWIADNSNLVGDSVLGPYEKRRFLPSRFDLRGNALDEEGNVCRNIACPQCHGLLARGLLEMPPLFLSILGAPRSGKSFYLGAMLERVDKILGECFPQLRFESSLNDQNQKIVGYRDMLFKPDDPNGWIWLEKNQVHDRDGLSRNVLLDGKDKRVSVPCLFAIQPQKEHPAYERATDISRMLCLYDCAGEYFIPGGVQEDGDSLVIDHLAKSDAMLFIFDPFQEPSFRDACAEVSDDPQVVNPRFRKTYDQSKVLSKAAERIRDRDNRPSSWKYNRPLIILVNKFDGWNHLVDGCAAELKKIVAQMPDGRFGINLTVIESVSRQVEALLKDNASSIVTAANGFAEKVLYLPVSATGGPPTFVQEPASGPERKSKLELAFRAGSINPRWVEIPILYVLSQCTGAAGHRGLIPAGRSRSSSSAEHSDEKSYPRLNRSLG